MASTTSAKSVNGGLKPKSCQPCRKSKVKCDRRFPCSRCLRLRIPCEDTVSGGMEEPVARLVSIYHMVPTLTNSGGFDLCLSRYGPKEISTEKATSFMYVGRNWGRMCVEGWDNAPPIIIMAIDSIDND